MTLFEKETISHTDGRPYLVRWKIIHTKWFGLFLHYFQTSDEDRDFHDHPFAYASVILWPGYREHTADSVERKYPGMVLFRKATHTHRVELLRRPDGSERRGWTLVFLTGKYREWGFHTKDGFVHNRDYINSKMEK